MNGQTEREWHRERERERRTNGRSSPSATSAQHRFGLFKLYDWKINGHDRRKARGGGGEQYKEGSYWRTGVGGRGSGRGEGEHNYSTVVRAQVTSFLVDNPKLAFRREAKPKRNAFLRIHQLSLSLSHTHTHTLPFSLFHSPLPRTRSVYCNNIAECKMKLNFLKWC